MADRNLALAVAAANYWFEPGLLVGLDADLRIAAGMKLRSGRIIQPVLQICSNCQKYPVTTAANCFKDWCLQCDSTLWETRFD
jgi:hypothetical protein